jgi:hypothetical protein
MPLVTVGPLFLRSPNQRLSNILDGVPAHGLILSADHGEADRPIEAW